MKARARARSAVGRTRRRLDGVEGVGDGGGGGVRLVEGPGMGDDGSRRGRPEGLGVDGDCRVGVSRAAVVEVAGTAPDSVAESPSESALGSVMCNNKQIDLKPI